jgi:anthranilate synthase component 2
MLLMIDNYDSFTYNLVQYFRALGQELVVRRNDDVSIEAIESMRPRYIDAQ